MAEDEAGRWCWGRQESELEEGWGGDGEGGAGDEEDEECAEEGGVVRRGDCGW